MKAVSATLRALIESGRHIAGGDVAGQFVPFDLYTITTTGGLVLTYTTADFPITAPSTEIFSAPKVLGGSGETWFAGITWQPGVIDGRDSRANGHWKIGLDSDTWTATVAPRQADTSAATIDLIGTEPWLVAAAAGVLDRADCIVSRAYFASMPTWPMPAAGAVPVGTMIMARGYIGDIDLTTSRAVINVNDYRQVLQQQMPRNYYQAPCRYPLGSARCGVALASYTRVGLAAAGSSRSQLIAAAAVAAPGGSATYELGRLTMTSGRNAGFSRTVRSWSGTDTFGLLTPLPYDISAGDTFNVVAGCHKTLADCTAFGAFANYGGEPFIPVPEISL